MSAPEKQDDGIFSNFSLFGVAMVMGLPLVPITVVSLLAVALGKHCPQALAGPFIFWLMFILSVPACTVTGLAVLGGFLGVAWWRKPADKMDRLLLVACSLAWLIHVAFLIWWYATGQEFD